MPPAHSFLRIEGRVAVVTGAAGIIGSAIVRRLASFGAAIALVDVNVEGLRRVTEELGEGAQARAFRCDVAVPDEIVATIREIIAWAGRIDILFNNAATKTDDLEAFFAPTEDYSIDTWRRVMSVNLDGLFIMARECAIDMMRHDGGSIVQTASIYGVMAPDMRVYEGSFYLDRGINTPPVYAASKGGVIALTRYLAALWSARGIRVNAISPGGVFSGQNSVFQEKYCARVPMGRMANAEEIADAAIFLASPAASYITGQNLIVDGGLSSW